jgi:hypothetical protein
VANDNVRTLYIDGMPLGADELDDDQTYFRAALERRSLARDLYGVAWGLELEMVGASPVVSPGVAYGPDGKAIVVREPVNIADLVEGDPDTKFEVFLYFAEEQRQNSEFTYCNRALDPRVEEAYAIKAFEKEGASKVLRRKALLEPHASLPADVTRPGADRRVCLGIVHRTLEDELKVVKQTRKVGCGLGEDVSNEGVDVIGVTGATFTHPLRNTDSVAQTATETSVAFEIGREKGVYFHDPLVVRSGLVLTDDGSISAKVAYDPGGGAIDPGVVIDICDGADAKTALAARVGAGGAELQVPEKLKVAGLATLGVTDVEGKLTTKDVIDAKKDVTIDSGAKLTAGAAVFTTAPVKATKGLDVEGATTTIKFEATNPAIPVDALVVSGRTRIVKDAVATGAHALEVKGSVLVEEAVQIEGGLNVDKLAVFDDQTQFKLKSTFKNQALFEGTSTFEKPVTFEDTVTFDSGVGFGAGATMTLPATTFTGTATFQTNAVFQGNTTLQSTVFNGAVQFGQAASFLGAANFNQDVGFDGRVVVQAICVRLNGVPHLPTYDNHFVGFDGTGAFIGRVGGSDRPVGVGAGAHSSGDLLVAVGGAIDVEVDAGHNIQAGKKVVLSTAAGTKGTVKAGTSATKVVGTALTAVNGNVVRVLVSVG